MDFLFVQLMKSFLTENLLIELAEDNEKLVIEYQKREEKLSDFLNDFLINKTNILWDKNGELKIPPSIFIEKFFEILKGYLNYTQLKYFSIPIIGKISSGKSTFLNSLLGIDCLESDINITTKFICIIRHNPDNKTPRLFPVKLVKRKSEINPNAYNFVKDELNELKGDLKENIKTINKRIQECGELSQLKKEEFFYILEADLDIFKGPNFVYSKMFEFLDIPGLNEITEFYLKNIIPIITPNTHFSIFLFDAGASEDEGSKVLFNKFLKLMNSKAKKDSFFIYNKLDIFRKDNKNKLKENEQILYFKNEILFQDYNLKLKNNHIVGLDSIQLKYDKKKGNNFSDYILAFIQSIPNFDKKKFTILFKNKLKEDFKLTKLNLIKDDQINENKTNEDENLLVSVNKALKQKYYDEIQISFLIQMKNVFNDNYKSLQNKIEENDKYNELFKLFNKSFKDTIDDFVGNNNLFLLIRAFNTLLIRLYELSSSKKEKEHIQGIILHMCKHFESILYPNMIFKKIEGIDDDIIRFRFINFEFEIKNIFDWNREIISSLHNNINKLKEFNSDLVNKMSLNVQNVLNYFDNRKIRITFIGQESSGKSSILRHIIGNKIFPLHTINKNSNINLVIQGSHDDNIELFNARINLLSNYLSFERGNEAIASGFDNVKKKLIELKMKETYFENSFYILKTPIEFFKIIQISKEILSKIEIIYLSGKYIKNLEFGLNKSLEVLIKYTDNFVYIEKESNISEKSFLFLKKIIFFIGIINNSFNLEKFLFVINKCNKNDITKTIIDPLKNFLPKVCWFSINEYENFVKLKNLVADGKTFFKSIINKIKEKGKYNLLDDIQKEIESLQNIKGNSFKNFFRRIFINTYLDWIFEKPRKYFEELNDILKSEGISEQDLEKHKAKINKIIHEFTILQNGIYDHIYYFNSNAEIFLSEFYNQIFNVKYYLDYNLKITTENTKNYLNSILSLINKKIMEDNPKFLFSSDNEKEQLINNFEDYFKDFKEKTLEHIEKYNKKYTSNIDDFYKNKFDLTKNVDKLMENEEKIYFDSLLDKFSNYNSTYDIYKEKNNINDISLQSKIFVNDYNRSYINKDSIKTEFRFGWFLLYSIKNKMQNKFLLPQNLCFLFDNKNLQKEQSKDYYAFRYNGLKYFINNILEDIYVDMRNNLEHIIQFKLENFSKVKENVNSFIEIYIDLFDLFDDNDEKNDKEEKI